MIELMTVGYEGQTPEAFFELLERCHVSMLVDVRELPISRRPGFAKSALKAAVTARGMKYEHVAELGCPRAVRHEYRDDGDWTNYTRRFKEYLETQETALERLAAWMQTERCCLVCYEEDYNFCHRSFVAERVVALAGDSVRIYHLTGPITGRVVRREAVAA